MTTRKPGPAQHNLGQPIRLTDQQALALAIPLDVDIARARAMWLLYAPAPLKRLLEAKPVGG